MTSRSSILPDQHILPLCMPFRLRRASK
jgi:hypothetical protein